MAVGRAERRQDREASFGEVFGDRSGIALDLFEIVELAWHDCYGEVAPPSGVESDILTVSQGDIDGLVKACLLALHDWRDLRLMASELGDV